MITLLDKEGEDIPNKSKFTEFTIGQGTETVVLRKSDNLVKSLHNLNYNGVHHMGYNFFMLLNLEKGLEII